MTDIKLLHLLNDYYNAQRNVVTYLLWAMEDFERGREHYSWDNLLAWCEAKDARDKLLSKFKHHHPRAVMLKEGYE